MKLNIVRNIHISELNGFWRCVFFLRCGADQRGFADFALYETAPNRPVRTPKIKSAPHHTAPHRTARCHRKTNVNSKTNRTELFDSNKNAKTVTSLQKSSSLLRRGAGTVRCDFDRGVKCTAPHRTKTKNTHTIRTAPHRTAPYDSETQKSAQPRHPRIRQREKPYRGSMLNREKPLLINFRAAGIPPPTAENVVHHQ